MTEDNKRRLIPFSFTNLFIFSAIFAALVISQISLKVSEKQGEPVAVAPVEITPEEDVKTEDNAEAVAEPEAVPEGELQGEAVAETVPSSGEAEKEGEAASETPTAEEADVEAAAGAVVALHDSMKEENTVTDKDKKSDGNKKTIPQEYVTDIPKEGKDLGDSQKEPENVKDKKKEEPEIRDKYKQNEGEEKVLQDDTSKIIEVVEEGKKMLTMEECREECSQIALQQAPSPEKKAKPAASMAAAVAKRASPPAVEESDPFTGGGEHDLDGPGVREHYKATNVVKIAKSKPSAEKSATNKLQELPDAGISAPPKQLSDRKPDVDALTSKPYIPESTE